MTWRESAALAAALAWSVGALAALGACAGEEATRPAPLPPVTTSPRKSHVSGMDRGGSARMAFDAGTTSLDDGGASESPAPPRPPPPPEPSFGSEPLKPGDPHAFRLALAVRAMRASPSGLKVLQMFSVVPEVMRARMRTGVDPFADGEWLLVYGSSVAAPGPNANVLKHIRSEAEVTKAVADGGFEAWDGGVGVRAEMYGVTDVLLRPQPGVMALVPTDRARELAAVLAKPIDPGVKPGELARVSFSEPAKLARFLPPEVQHATVIVKAASDGGLDASADADCPDAASCKTIATAIDELVKRQNGLLVRLVLGNVLGSFTVRAEAAKLHATLHAMPQHVDAALNFLRSELGLPAATEPQSTSP